MVPLTRRQCFAAGAAALLGGCRSAAAPKKPMAGAFPIMATPYTESKAVDYEDLAGEVEFLDRCGVQGMVWPQMASEYDQLSEDERMQGMEVIAKAARGKKPALVLGVQGEDKAQMLRYATHAEALGPDAIIAMPPKQAETLADFEDYYRALCRLTRRPVFIQTTGGAKDIEPTVDFIVKLAGEFENFGYVKEEYKPTLPRMLELHRRRSEGIKAIFGGMGGRDWTYEMRLGFDGTMPGAMWSDLYAQIWEAWLEKDWAKIGQIYPMVALGLNTLQTVDGGRQFMFQKRGVFKTRVSRRGDYEYTPEEEAELEWTLETMRPWLRV